MSGRTPCHTFTVQPGAPYENCGIKVDQAVNALHAQIPVLWAVVLPKFEPEPLRTGLKFSSKFSTFAEPDLKFGSGFSRIK